MHQERLLAGLCPGLLGKKNHSPEPLARELGKECSSLTSRSQRRFVVGGKEEEEFIYQNIAYIQLRAISHYKNITKYCVCKHELKGYQ